MAFQKGNKYSLGLTNNGRPPLYDTVQELEEKINKYFNEECIPETIGEHIIWNYPTVCGLALYLGFAQRKSLLDYKGRSDDFCNTIKRAVTVIENSYEQRLSMNNATGSIFALKNMGWKDQSQIDQNINGSMTWNEVKNYEEKKEENT